MDPTYLLQWDGASRREVGEGDSFMGLVDEGLIHLHLREEEGFIMEEEDSVVEDEDRLQLRCLHEIDLMCMYLY